MTSLGQCGVSERDKRLGAMAHGAGAIASLGGLGALPAALVWALSRGSPFAARHARAALIVQLALTLCAALGSLALSGLARASFFAIAFRFIPCVWLLGAAIAALGVIQALKGQPFGAHAPSGLGG